MTQLLALRSFGDFVVLMHAIKQSRSNQKINIIASDHLKPLWEALNVSNAKPNLNIQIEFIDFGVKKGLFSFFTNKFFFSKNNIAELLALRRFIKAKNFSSNDGLYLERKNRKYLLQLILGKKLFSVHHKGNVYESALGFFQSEGSINTDYFKIDKIVVFPDSRKKEKIIPKNVLVQLASSCMHHEIEFTTAFFGSTTPNDKYIFFYNDFFTLIKLIQEAQFIISSDSVTAHLAQYFNKPHFIFYPNKVNFEWLTPWALNNEMYTTFDHAHVLIDKIDKA